MYNQLAKWRSLPVSNVPSAQSLSFPAELSAETGSLDVAVLTSGGIESTILVALLRQHFQRVHPIYVQFGHQWERAELSHLKRFLQAINHPKLAPLQVLTVPIEDLYTDHWSNTGVGVPDAHTPDSAVYLPGRNILLTAKTAVWCALHNISIIAHGSLMSNPFSDATPKFFDALNSAYSHGLDKAISVIRPFKQMHKEDVLKLGTDLPLEHSFSCIQPQLLNLEENKSRFSIKSGLDDDQRGSSGAAIERHPAGAMHGGALTSRDSGDQTFGTTLDFARLNNGDDFVHCGQCNKCQERQHAFARVDFADPSFYFNDTLSAKGDLCIK